MVAAAEEAAAVAAAAVAAAAMAKETAVAAVAAVSRRRQRRRRSKRLWQSLRPRRRPAWVEERGEGIVTLRIARRVEWRHQQCETIKIYLLFGAKRNPSSPPLHCPHPPSSSDVSNLPYNTTPHFGHLPPSDPNPRIQTLGSHPRIPTCRRTGVRQETTLGGRWPGSHSPDIGE